MLRVDCRLLLPNIDILAEELRVRYFFYILAENGRLPSLMTSFYIVDGVPAHNLRSKAHRWGWLCMPVVVNLLP